MRKQKSCQIRISEEMRDELILIRDFNGCKSINEVIEFILNKNVRRPQ